MQETTDTAISNTPPTPRTDRLELVKELGRGSIGVVHKAKNPQQGRVSALRQFEVPQWLSLGLIVVIFSASYLYATRRGPAPEGDVETATEAERAVGRE